MAYQSIFSGSSTPTKPKPSGGGYQSVLGITVAKPPSSEELTKTRTETAKSSKTTNDQQVAAAIADAKKESAKKKSLSLWGKAKKLTKDYVVDPTVNTVDKSINTVGAGVAGVVGLSTAGYQAATGNKKGAKATVNATQQEIDELLTKGAGGKGSYLTPKQAREGGTQLIKPGAQAVTDIAPMVVPFGRTLKPGASLLKKVITSTVDNAALGGGTTAANEVIQTGHIDPKEVVKGTVVGGLFGAAAPLVHGGVKAGSEKASFKGAQETLNRARTNTLLDKVRPKEEPPTSAPQPIIEQPTPPPPRPTNTIPEAEIVKAETRKAAPVDDTPKTAVEHVSAPEAPAEAVKTAPAPKESAPAKPVGGGKPLTPLETVHMPEVSGYTHSSHMVQDYADMLRGQEKDATVSTVPDGKGGYKRVTEHSAFYRAYYKENGRPPTKADYLVEAKKHLESGNDAFGAGADYKTLVDRENTPQPGMKFEPNTIPDKERMTPLSEAIAERKKTLGNKTVTPAESAVEATSGKTLPSRVYKRLSDEHPEELPGKKLQYTPIKLKEEAAKAADLIVADKNKAFRVAMGAEPSSDITSTAVNIAMSEKALEDGNVSLYSQLVKARSLAQTRRGQEIVSEKGSVTDNSTGRYVRELIASRLGKLGKGYFSDLKDPLQRHTPAQRATQQIDKEVAKAQTQVRRSGNIKFKDAQAIIDSLAC